MSYKINKTDGTRLVDLIDGRIDQSTTDITLLGKNYTGYGEFWNENFVRILENFANVAQPIRPLVGQLWYDTSEARLKVYNGSIFKATDTTTVSPTEPTLLAGDIWIDSAKKQIKFSDGNDIILAGPIYTQDQGVTGFDVITLIDRFGVNKTVTRLMIGNSPVALISKETFTAPNVTPNTQYLTGFSSSIEAGINISTDYSDFKFYGTAQTTSSLIDDSLVEYTPDDFLKIAANNTTTGTLHVKNDNGLIVGDDSDLVIKVEGTSAVLRNQTVGSDFKIQIRQGISNIEPFTIQNSTSRIGFWKTSPEYDVDINGDVRISGDLIVDGAATYLDVATLRVEDKLIELAITADSTLLSDAAVDGAGISVRASGVEKTLTWGNTYNTWNSSCNFNIPTGFAYKIGNADVLTATALSANVTSAVGLTQIGTLGSLNIDNINLNNATITTTTLPLTIQSAGDIVISSSRKITGVGTATALDSNSTVVNKAYLSQVVNALTLSLSLDITGLTNNNIASVLEDISPAVNKPVGTIALVHCIAYSGSSSYNAADELSKTYVAVDKNGVENQSVLADISFTTATGTVSLSVTRSLKRFVVDVTNNWVFDADLVSSV
jgi:hypothetical protein